jgi:surface polysaccharide O-acyltransferase-like enzyme
MHGYIFAQKYKNMGNNIQDQRVVFLDYLRVIACFMVIMVHSCEFFFIDGGSIGIRSVSDGFWVSVIDSALRSSVPLFVMASSYLLLPLKGSSSGFFKRRFSRVVIPFAVWSLLYAAIPLLWGGLTIEGVKSNLVCLLFNFTPSSGHLWFIYMLIGLYLFMPVLSPWLEKVSKRGERLFIAIWFCSSFWPYLRVLAGNITGNPDIYGESYWNEFHVLWYFSGFTGYLVLAHYIRKYIDWTVRKSVCIGVPVFVAGYIFTAVVWYNNIFTADTLKSLELSWRFCTFNVVFMTFGVFVLLKSLFRKTRQVPFVIREISRLSYGMYLMHIFILGFSYEIIKGYFSTPVTILLVGIMTIVSCIIIFRLLSFLPKSKYIVG